MCGRLANGTRGSNQELSPDKFINDRPILGRVPILSKQVHRQSGNRVDLMRRRDQPFACPAHLAIFPAT